MKLSKNNRLAASKKSEVKSKRRISVLPLTSYFLRLFAGGGKRIRTADHLVANQALSQLSYTPKIQFAFPVAGYGFYRGRVTLNSNCFLVGLGRFELPTSRLSGVRSNHLSYRPFGYGLQPDEKSSFSKNRWRKPFTPFVPSKLNSKSCVGTDLDDLFSLAEDFDLLRKEVIQPQVPLRLPCYDFTPIIDHTLGACPLDCSRLASDFWYNQLSWCDGRCVQGPGTYSPRHADPRLLAIPTSRSRVADSDPN